MNHLQTISDRLRNRKISKIEIYQRQVFERLLKDAAFLLNSRALSVSCGDGVWDYIALKGAFNLSFIEATDIVSCPVNRADQDQLQNLGHWNFNQVLKEAPLPFDNDKFDLVFHQDVI